MHRFSLFDDTFMHFITSMSKGMATQMDFKTIFSWFSLKQNAVLTSFTVML